MAKIHTLRIENFRGIQQLEHIFGTTNFVCLIGRGDSGKTTILHAISAVLSPRWNYSFYDTDFYSENVENSIIIEASLTEVAEELISDSKFGLYKRLLNKDGMIIDDLQKEDDETNQDVLTIRLIVKKDLEPKWFVVNNRENQDDIEIRAGDRAKFNVFLVSDYLERHFSWNKGNPLYSLIKEKGITDEKGEILTKAYRDAKNSVSKQSFNYLDTVIKDLKKSAILLGMSVEDISTSIDFRDIFVRDGKVSLHSDKMPFRLKGKGTKRLLSIAIQLELAKQGGIILIDELEQGLEPDRARFVAKTLKDRDDLQAFVTTHSSNILAELNYNNLFLRHQNRKNLITFHEDFQGCLRNNPEAFFAKRVIVCEGATEVGICRALNAYRTKHGNLNLAVLGIAIVDGEGSSFKNYIYNFHNAKIDICVFCDSDRDDINKMKPTYLKAGIGVVDCDENYSIEEQLFKDLSWKVVIELINYAIDQGNTQSIVDSTGKSIEELTKEDTNEVRILIGEKAKKHGWFKRIDHGEFIGETWFDSLQEIEGKQLCKQYDLLNEWIEK